MDRIRQQKMADSQAALWLLGQAGCVVRSAGITAVIDPYLTDSVGASAPDFTRLFPAPIAPEHLEADLFVVTHDHADHLDPETIRRYRHGTTTDFIAPHLAAGKLRALDISAGRIHAVGAGEAITLRGVEIRGTYAVPTGPDVLDTTGYVLTFPNGRSLYHSADTGFSPLLLKAAPRAEVLLVAINGKWGNLDAGQAVELASAVRPRFVIPNHYDLMALNSENPETFRFLCRDGNLAARCVIPAVMEAFVWG
ncbi:MAG: MBL fold metallo-hydrolase [Planctomycetota bacterium]